MELFIHQITLFIAVLLIPYCILHYAKDVVKPERRYNGKIHWTLLPINIIITIMMTWSFVLYIVPAFAHYVMLITVKNPPAISLTSDIVFLSVMAACLIVFCWLKIRQRRKRWQRRKHWQASGMET